MRRLLVCRGGVFGLALFGCRLGFPELGLFYRRFQFRRGKLLPVEGNLGGAHLGEKLAVPLQLLILFFALVVEDQDLVSAPLFEHLAAHPRALALRTANFALFSADGQHVGELKLALFGKLLLNANYVSGSNTILFSPGADDREHRIPPSFELAKSILRTGSAQGLPEGIGTAGKPSYFSVWGAGRSNCDFRRWCPNLRNWLKFGALTLVCIYVAEFGAFLAIGRRAAYCTHVAESRPVLNPKDIGIKQLSVKAEIGLIRQKGQRFLVPQGETFHGSTVSADMNSINRYFGIHPRKDIAAFHGGCCPDGCFEFCGYRPRNEKHIFLFSLWQIRVFPEGYDFKDYDSVYATRGGFPDVDK